MFRSSYNIAWEFHRNTSRWPHNTLSLLEETRVIAPFKEYYSSLTISLPQVPLPDAGIRELIESRCSCRDYVNKPVELEKIAVVLKAGYGVIGKSVIEEMEFYERPVPSGGGLYSLELYLLSINVIGLDPGIYHYAPGCHILEQLRLIPLEPMFLSNLFMHQPYLSGCGAIVVVSSVVDRNMRKYADRGYRYILFEAGHSVQNMNLVSGGINLGTLNLGGFFDTHLSGLLGIDEQEEIPLYCMALGYPASQTKDLQRITSK